MQKEFENIYFIGIGGIGMSALARYFKHEGKNVAGYDRTSTPLTQDLQKEGIEVHYKDDVSLIDNIFLDKSKTIVVYTPAVPVSHSEFSYFLDNGFDIVKRSQMLGVIAANKYVMAVAGTHGKTSTSTLLAWLNGRAALCDDGSIGGGSAFLGGISKNFDSNMVLGRPNRLTVEADEFDRSFLRLYPNVALITSTDADHLDIYHTHEELKNAFSEFVLQIVPHGTLIYKYGIDLRVSNNDIDVYTYSLDNCNASFYAKNIRQRQHGLYSFDIVCPNMIIEDCTLGIPGLLNVENCIGAVSMIWVAGFDVENLKMALKEFKGVKRRMDFRLVTDSIVYIDDYAHHPSELSSTIDSLRDIYPDRKITAIFQPHLYTRTRDFALGFAKVLSSVDKLILLPIYPAREEPIEGVSSEIILDMVTLEDKKIVAKDKLIDYIKKEDLDILVTFGAGDIDALCSGICDKLKI